MPRPMIMPLRVSPELRRLVDVSLQSIFPNKSAHLGPLEAVLPRPDEFDGHQFDFGFVGFGDRSIGYGDAPGINDTGGKASGLICRILSGREGTGEVTGRG